MTGFLAFLEYDGTAFSGWQAQPGCRTVQDVFEKALCSILGEKLRVTGAGRTDGGVHALAQAVSFHTDKKITPFRLQAALNAVLPQDIAVSRIRTVPQGYNARFDARGKIYQYRIWNRQYRSVWAQAYAWHITRPLDLPAMRRAARSLTGTHDFRAFRAAGSKEGSTRVQMRCIKIRRWNGFVLIDLEADRFLYKMVRNIVGTLAEVGRGKMRPEEVAEILKGKDRRAAARTAPPQGLFMKKVFYNYEKE